MLSYPMEETMNKISKIPPIKAGEYKHNKTGKLYTVLYVAIDKNNDTQLQVVYRDNHDIYIREINDFLDKFSKVTNNGE